MQKEAEIRRKKEAAKKAKKEEVKQLFKDRGLDKRNKEVAPTETVEAQCEHNPDSPTCIGPQSGQKV